jgi:glycosyltransferase involved in cell wall biosynthesis
VSAFEGLRKAMKLLIIGFARPGHMGNYLSLAANQLGIDYSMIDAGGAEADSRIVRSFYWRLRGKRPARLARFGAEVLEKSKGMNPSLVLGTGYAPLDRLHIDTLRARGARVVNYSTDDPWNPALRAPWFLSTINAYDAVFTTRRANIDDFRKCGVREVHHVPFAYDPDIHRPSPADKREDRGSDVLFVGGCDADRIPLINALVDAGLNVALFGGYWDRHPKTRPYWRGMADQDTIRAATAAARVSLVLVRRANRDDAVMRSYEAAAIGGCILAEDTPEHRELYGADGESTYYFNTTDELVQRAKMLVSDPELRGRLSTELRKRILVGDHTYADRLAEMIRLSLGNDVRPKRAAAATV